MKVLLVEDDKFFQKFYTYKLQENNIKVEVASDGEEGLRKMQKDKPDIVLLDLIMPNKDGFYVLENRLQNIGLKKIPVIVLSLLGQEKDIEKAKSLGATDYISKSFLNFNQVLEKIAKVTKH